MGQRRLMLVGLLVMATVVSGIICGDILVDSLRSESASLEGEWNRKIEATKTEVNANDAAKAWSEADEVIVGVGVGPEGCLRYLWIQGLQDGSSEVIYIATEAGLPVLETGRGLGK